MRRVLRTARNRTLPLAAHLSRRPESGDDETILLMQPDHLGDVLLAQPAVIGLRRSLPRSRLIAVIGPWSRGITELAWPVDDIVEVRYPGFDRTSRASRIDPYRMLVSAAQDLSGLRAGRAVVLRYDAWWTAWLARLSVSSTVVGSCDPRVRAFVDVPVEVSEGTHVTERAITIMSALDSDVGAHAPSNPHLERPAPDVSSRVLGSLGISRPFVVIHPGAGAPVKHWPVRSWRAVVDALREHQVILTGAESERDMCESIQAGFDHARSIAGVTSLSDLVTVLANATVAVGTDNGPLHLAVALGTPTVHLFGPSSITEFGPRGEAESHRVLSAGWTCPRCRDLSPSRPPVCGCMAAIRHEHVIEEVEALLRSVEAHATSN